MKTKTEVTERMVRINVHNFNKEIGHLNEQKAIVSLQKGHKPKMQYELIQSLKLTKKQQSLLLKFVESLSE